MPKVLFVCTGNTCRSPMAASIAYNCYKKYPLIKFFSRGLSVTFPSRASENAILAVEQIYSSELQNHISKQIKQEDIDNAAIIVTMTHSHKEYIENIFELSGKKVYTLKEAGGSNGDIVDPFGNDLFVYRQCADEIKKYLNADFEDKLKTIGSD